MKKITILITIFTGIFIYQIRSGANLVDIPQFAYFLLSAGLLFSFTLRNKYLTFISQLIFVSIFITFLDGKTNMQFFKDILIIFSALCVYKYFLEKKINVLKYLMIPAGLNSLFIILQCFSSNILPFNSSISGFLGNAGFTGCFIGVTAPIFLSYFPIGWFLCIFALIIGKSFVGLTAFLISSLVWLYFRNKRLFITLSVITILSIPLLKYIANIHEIIFRIASWLGTLDGIKYHWAKGWGLGSFFDIMSQNNDIYHGISFNTASAKLNHPANEILYGWWNFGILFVILSALYVIDLFKQFTKDKLIVFCVLIGCLCVSMGFMFTPPLLFIAMAALGIYEKGGINGKESYC